MKLTDAKTSSALSALSSPCSSSSLCVGRRWRRRKSLMRITYSGKGSPSCPHRDLTIGAGAAFSISGSSSSSSPPSSSPSPSREEEVERQEKLAREEEEGRRGCPSSFSPSHCPPSLCRRSTKMRKG
eukprot:scaffold90725_cov33-Tisochrysis_lutea.AAC.3